MTTRLIKVRFLDYFNSILSLRVQMALLSIDTYSLYRELPNTKTRRKVYNNL